jgi:hypothetical protein
MEMTRPLRSEPSVSTTAFPVYVGYDRREDIAYQVCRQSLLRNASIPLDIEPLVQDSLRA